MLSLLYWIPTGTALAGWLAVSLTGKLAFRPKQPLVLGPLVLQGAIPRQRRAIITALTRIVATELSNGGGLKEQVEKLDISNDVTSMLSGRIDVVLDKFVQQTPIAAMILNDAIKDRIKGLVITEVGNELPALQRSIADKMMSQMNPAQSIQAKIESLDWNKFEESAEEAAQGALCNARWFGAAIGLVVGLIEVALVSLV